MKKYWIAICSTLGLGLVASPAQATVLNLVGDAAVRVNKFETADMRIL